MVMRFARYFSAFLLGLLLSLIWRIPTSFAQQSFSDVPVGDPVYEAVEFLKEKGVIEGYSDGTYQSKKKLNRAEALKFIIAPLVNSERIAQEKSTVFNDIPADGWYLPYVEIARKDRIIDGPPAKSAFNGPNLVIKAEFLKMLLLAHKIDTNAFSEIRLPLSGDVANPDEWLYPYMRSAIAHSMIMISTQGALEPAQQLTRGDAALLLYRLIMYKDNRRTQALLSEAESEILIILAMLDQNNIAEAEYASARALLAARGAHASRANDPTIIGALKTTEAFRALVRAYRAGLSRDYDTVIQLTKDAWGLAETARKTAPTLENLALQVQTIAKTMADSARAAKGG